jgi:large subunit ribosomal protein L10
MRLLGCFFMLTKQKKGEILKDLEAGLKKAKIVVFVNFHGLNVSASQKLRKLLREIGVKYLVVKKTLVKKALKTIKFDGEMPEMEGELALAYSDGDPLASTKILGKFAKENKTVKLVGGIWENKYINSEMVLILANIPSREILLGKLVYIINSPVQRLVVALGRIKK